MKVHAIVLSSLKNQTNLSERKNDIAAMSVNHNGSTQGNNNGNVPVDSGIQESYRNLSENIQLVGGEINNQQKQNFYVVANCQAMVEDALHLQRCYCDVLAEVHDIRTAIRAADAKLSYVSRRIHEFVPIEDLVVHHDGYTYSRNSLPKDVKPSSASSGNPTEHHTEEESGEALLPNRTLIMMLEKLAGLFPPSERGSPYSNLPLGDDLYCFSPAMVGGMLGSAATRRPQDNTGMYNSYPSPLTMRSASSTHPQQPQSQSQHHQHTTALQPQQQPSPGSVQQNGTATYHREVTEKFHPCLRVYGTCNYGRNCAYAKYPYDACLSNLKGRCRFGNQCHERHVEYIGPLDDNGAPVTSSHTDGG